MKKLQSIQVLRAIAAMSVVLYHLLVIEKKYSGGDIHLPDIFRTGQAGVDLFFVISGFIMVNITQKKWLSGGISTGDFLLHRFARIYPNYWFYVFITLCILFVRPDFVNSSQGNHVDIFSSFFLLPSHTPPIVLVGWSLIYEVYFYMVFAFLLKLGKKGIMPGLLLWLTFLLLVHSFVEVDSGPLVKLLTSPYSIEFILGALSALLLERLQVNAVVYRRYLIVILLIVTALIPFAFDWFYSPVNNSSLMQCIVFGIIFSVIVNCSVLIEMAAQKKVVSFISTIGDASYTIYLSHVFILSMIGRIWAGYFQYPLQAWDNFLVVLVACTSIIFYSLAASRLFEYPSYKFVIKLLSRQRRSGSAGLRLH